jgi:hypothetical protein
MTDDDLREMLERRVARAEGLGDTLPERARAVARRPGSRGASVTRFAAGGRDRRVAAPRRMPAAASLVATLVVAIGLLAVLAGRPEAAMPGVGSPDPSHPPASSVPGSLDPWSAVTWRRAGTSRPPFAPWGEPRRFLVDVVAWGNGVVAVGYDFEGDHATGLVWRSSDGLDWHEVAVGDLFDGVAFEAVLALEDRLVARGRHRGAGIPPGEAGWPVAFESTDGASWAPLATEDTPWARTGELQFVAGGGHVLALDTGDGRLWRIADDRSWTSAPLEKAFPGTSIATIAWTGERWLAGGVAGDPTDNYQRGTGAIWVSENGVTWSPATIDAPRMNVGRFVTGRDGVVAVGSSTGFGGAIVLTQPMWRSDDGATWSRLTLDGRILRVVSDGDRLIALDTLVDGRLTLSESFDGEQWRSLEVRGLGRFDPENPATLDGHVFPGQFDRVLLTAGGIWAISEQRVEDTSGVETEVEVRWFGEPGVVAGAATFPPRPEPGADDVRCVGGQPCGP